MLRFVRVLSISLLAAVAVFAVATPAFAGSPHFVDDKVQISRSGDTLTAQFKEAGLGDEPQIHVILSADAQCDNPGDNQPQANNKQTFTSTGDFPVQNGKAEGTLSVTAEFDPSAPCPDPMNIRYSNVVVTDVTSGITYSAPGPF